MRTVARHRLYVRWFRWRSVAPFGVAVLLSASLVYTSAVNLRSVRDTARQAQRSRVKDLVMATNHAIHGIGFATDRDSLRAGMQSLVRGPVISLELLDRKGRQIVASPPRTTALWTRTAVAGIERNHRLKTLRQRPGADGDLPTYDAVVLFKPALPAHLRKWMALANKRMPEKFRGLRPMLGPGRIYLAVGVTLQDEASLRAVARARRALIISVVVAVVLMVMAVFAFFGERRVTRAQVALQGQQALAEMGEMASVLAHEIRNPLGIIKGRAQVLLEDEGPPPREALAGLVEQSARLERLVNTLLEFARPAPPRLQQLEGEALVQQALEAVAELAVQRQVALLPDLTPTRLTGDPEQLHRALVNLLQNALQLSPQGSSVVVNLRSRSGRALLSVTDAGPGLPADLGHTIFKPFVTTRQEGSGLGLAVVRRIAEAHGGEVAAETIPERGARFTLSLPLDGPSLAAPPERAL